MRVLYSKQALKFLLARDEKYVATVLEIIKKALKETPGIEYIPLPKYNDKRKCIQVDPYFVVVQKKHYKGKIVFYVSDILDEDEFEYYRI